jgi:hypothetical protein
MVAKMKSTAVFCIIVLSVATSCDFGLSQYFEFGDPEVNRRFAAMSSADITEIRISPDRGGNNASHLARTHWATLLDLLGTMPPAKRIGSGPWTDQLVIHIDTLDGRYRISLSTRPKLEGRVFAIVKGGKSSDEFLSFHDGDVLWEWLSEVPGLFGDEHDA